VRALRHQFDALTSTPLPLGPRCANSIAVVAAGLTSVAASRPELRGTGPRLAGWATVTALGAAAGAALVLLTSGAVFAWLVPFLVAIGPANARRARADILRRVIAAAGFMLAGWLLLNAIGR
jgi:hypothetical protein